MRMMSNIERSERLRNYSRLRRTAERLDNDAFARSVRIEDFVNPLLAMFCGGQIEDERLVHEIAVGGKL